MARKERWKPAQALSLVRRTCRLSPTTIWVKNGDDSPSGDFQDNLDISQFVEARIQLISWRPILIAPLDRNFDQPFQIFISNDIKRSNLVSSVWAFRSYSG